ncbi:ClpP/crotonase-like domain-containing protein [Entophlyctis helioformis]|nr:ClpP/crotonase-like domain-containing protein [Entophlyctis helioformis]
MRSAVGLVGVSLRSALAAQTPFSARAAPLWAATTGKRALHTAQRECTVEALQGTDAGIFVVALNRPAAKNALGRTLLAQFRDALNSLRFNEQARVVIVKSNVDGVFCAGADLKERRTMEPAEVASFVHSLRSSFTELESLPMPTIAVIDGFALGGGLELALAADLRVAGPSAKLGLPETKLAIIPGAGGTQRLPRLIGASKAKELIFTARVLSSKEALEYGIVNYAVEGSPYTKALDLARAIVPNGPIAVKMAKLAVNHGSELDASSGLAFEQTCYAQVIPTKDRIEGLNAFKEKRAPVYKGN